MDIIIADVKIYYWIFKKNMIESVEKEVK